MSQRIDFVKPLSQEHFDDLLKMSESHWWYLCRMDWVISESLKIFKKNPLIKFIDIGAGVGSVSDNMKKYLGLDVTSVENDPYACAVIRSKKLKLIECNIEKNENIPKELSEGENAFFFLDVLEHLENPKEVLKILAQNPKELYCIATVPALDFLYSYWDIELGHFTRYNKKSFIQMVEGTGWQILKINYFFLFAVFPAFFYRKILALFKSNKGLIIPKSYPWVNFIIRRIYKTEKFLNEKLFNIPFGTSLMVIMRKESQLCDPTSNKNIY